jgi:glycosyltransferase involved in cell wall biosynthesis
VQSVPLTIFQVLEFNQFNTGSVHQMFQAASGLRQRGHLVTIVSRPGPALEQRSRAAGIDFLGLPFRHQFDLATIRGLRRLVNERNPDVIHVHKGLAHALGQAATWPRRIPAFVVNRGVSFPLDVWNRGKYRSDRVDRIITVCQQIKDVIVSSGRLPPEKVVVVYAGTDVDLFDPRRWDRRAFRREKGIGENRFLVAQVGVRDWKGWRELVHAVADVLPTHPEVHLALIGCRTDEERRNVLDFAGSVGIAHAVSAIEYRDDMPNVFASCDAVVDASWAGTGITGTIREAMAMEKAVIATDCGGNTELVSTSEVGWLIPAKEPAFLSAALREVIDDQARQQAVGQAARQRVVDGFSKDLRITRLESLYREIIAAKKR